jgi:GDPmannose 4,6-dehydratase
MGNIDALRDWGHAKDYVRMQWLMLQQDQPEDFVIATGVQYSVRQFIDWSAQELGMQLRWEGQGVDEVAYWLNAPNDPKAPGSPLPPLGDGRFGGSPPLAPRAIVRVDPRYFRPTEVETLLGDPTKAKEQLGWVPEITVQQMCAEMVRADLTEARRNTLLKASGFEIQVSSE